MPCVKYVKKNFRPDTLAIIAKANAIIVKYQKQGFKLTLRQLYYQFIAKDLFPESWIDPVYNVKHRLPVDTKNTLKNYKHLGDIINDGRLAGLIDWLAIEDRTRNLESVPTWDNPNEIIRVCANQYEVDLWEDQPCHLEVWIEKEALVGVIEDVCSELQVPYFACKGYTSQSEMWEASQRLRRFESNGLTTTIIHLGDHDPSGLDMTRDIQERLTMFQSTVTVDRVALTWEQVGEYGPPPNPAKTTDARFQKYQDQYGDDSWELDALEPATMSELIRTTVESHIDWDCWHESKHRQQLGRNKLRQVAKHWDVVTQNLPDDGDEDEDE